jgi:hypothetical protein
MPVLATRNSTEARSWLVGKQASARSHSFKKRSQCRHPASTSAVAASQPVRRIHPGSLEDILRLLPVFIPLRNMDILNNLRPVSDGIKSRSSFVPALAQEPENRHASA